MQRITQNDLNKRLNRLNANRPADDAWNAKGRYDFDQAYGAIKLVQYTEGGCTRDLTGFYSKRELFNIMVNMAAPLQSPAFKYTCADK